ncbi:leucine-rich repeat protein, partial [Anaerostipes hadrus]
QNLFGDTIEPWHNCYGDLSNDDKNKQTIQTVAIPGTVNQLEIATFSGMKKLKSVVIPEQTASVPAYTFAKCSALSKVTFSKNMNEIDSTAFVKSNQVKTFSCPKANKTFAVKKGMLTTRSGKTLVLVPNKMKKLTIPSSVKEIKANALNGSQATSIVIPKSVKKIGAKALESKKITKVSLSSKNKTYKMANNCIYRKS